MARTKTQLAEAPLEKAAVRIGPSEKNADSEGGVYSEATAVTHLTRVIRPEWKERWVTVQAIGFNVDLVCGDASAEATYGQASAVDGSGNITTSDKTGGTFFADQTDDFFMEGRHTHFSFEAAGVGKIKIFPSSRKAP